MIRETVVVGPLEVNCYLCAQGPGRKALIIDPGDDEEKLLGRLEALSLAPGLVLNTHGHYDHIGCDDCFGVEVRVHELDAPMLTSARLNMSVALGDFYKVRSIILPLKDGETVELDGMRLRVIHTPGHTPGGSCFLLEAPETDMLFSGDTLFHGSVGRTDFPGGDPRALTRSLKKLLALPERTLVLPGHGPSTTIGAEKRDNPYLGMAR